MARLVFVIGVHLVLAVTVSIRVSITNQQVQVLKERSPQSASGWQTPHAATVGCGGDMPPTLAETLSSKEYHKHLGCCGKSVVIKFEYRVTPPGINNAPDRHLKKRLWGAQCCRGDEWVRSDLTKCRDGKELPKEKSPKPARMYCGNRMLGNYREGFEVPKCCGNLPLKSSDTKDALCCGDILVSSDLEHRCISLLWKDEEHVKTHLNVGMNSTVSELRGRFQEYFDLPDEDTAEHHFFAEPDADGQLPEHGDVPDVVYVAWQRPMGERWQ